MIGFVALKRIAAGDHHLRPGRTRRRWNGKDFPPFASLEIAQHSKDGGFYLLHICATGEVADKSRWKTPCIKQTSSLECKKTNAYARVH